MSDEKKDEKKKEPQGCLVMTIALLSAILAVLMLVCMEKVALKDAIPDIPAWIEAMKNDDPVVVTKPEATKPSQNKNDADQLVDEIAELIDKLQSVLNDQNKKVESAGKPTAQKPAVTEPTTKKPQTTQPVTTKPTQPTQPTTQKPTVTEPTTEDPEERDVLVVIDAGHQAKGDRGKEPIGPGAEILKTKVSSGTQGVETGVPEYELNLQVAMKLKSLLESRGYAVKMVRNSNDVNISNAQRAEFANEQKADVFVRIHANGDENSSTHGILTICQTANNPYNSSLYPQCKLLSQHVLDETVKTTGAKKMFVWETDTMTGINWCKVPVTTIEMGYMSNPEEDKLLSTEEYQQKLAEGIANGIEKYLAG